jgi:F-type H+-transporting ATPase subunit b
MGVMTNAMMNLRACARVTGLVLAVALAAAAAPAAAQEHGAAQPPPAAGAQPAAPGAHPADDHEEAHEEGLLPTVARLLNFAILAGVLGYFLKAPLAGYLQSRGAQIRQDLVTAAEMRKAAGAQLEEIERRLKSLPGELEELRVRGAEDVRAEQARIAQAAAAERQRLVDQTRREIDMRLRVARRELTEHAARLAVQVARTRISASITADDQVRLLDRYTAQLKEAR